MVMDDSIKKKYLSGQTLDSYKDHWVYSAVGREHMFETPDPAHRDWVSKLYDRLKNQIHNFVPRNYKMVKELFPCFDDVAREYTILLVVGFPDPYDAMVLSHNHTEYMVFDLIQFGQESLDEEYSCHRVLTHELIHICLHRAYRKPDNLSYTGSLDYTAFDEGFAHALTYPKDIYNFHFDDPLKNKYNHAKRNLRYALSEMDSEKQVTYRISADTGDYWDKFASIGGKLYILKNINRIFDIYNSGWSSFATLIINDDCTE